MKKRPGSLPAFVFPFVMPSLFAGHDDSERAQFEARFGGEAGHDLIRVS
jgi:hypothetical protein